MFCVLLPLARMKMSRKEFIDAMHIRGLGIGVSYEAMHLTTLFREDGHREGEFPNAERIARETVTLPLHAAMSEGDVDRVCDALEELLPA
jgi:dTDP-4-amino-4,6-dideoxygalactose transaminase